MNTDNQGNHQSHSAMGWVAGAAIVGLAAVGVAALTKSTPVLRAKTGETAEELCDKIEMSFTELDQRYKLA